MPFPACVLLHFSLSPCLSPGCRRYRLILAGSSAVVQAGPASTQGLPMPRRRRRGGLTIPGNAGRSTRSPAVPPMITVFCNIWIWCGLPGGCGSGPPTSKSAGSRRWAWRTSSPTDAGQGHAGIRWSAGPLYTHLRMPWHARCGRKHAYWYECRCHVGCPWRMPWHARCGRKHAYRYECRCHVGCPCTIRVHRRQCNLSYSSNILLSGRYSWRYSGENKFPGKNGS